MTDASPDVNTHSHVFLGKGHERNERRTWIVIGLCGAMMLLEIVGGLLFHSIALVADGLHMSTHAGALLLAALAYRFARKYAHDERFTFGTGKLGDLAGFTSAIVLAMIALLIGYEAISRLLAPVPIQFAEAIPIACLGLAVNIASVWLLGGGDHHHSHGHGHGHSHGAEAGHDDEAQRLELSQGAATLEIHEDGAPPRFRLSFDDPDVRADDLTITTARPDGSRQSFAMLLRGPYWESHATVPEPHAFAAEVRMAGELEVSVVFEEHEHAHGAAHRDNNMRAAVVHVVADAAVSVLVIVGLLLARAFGWLWMDALAGIVGACVIASWSWGLVRDTGAILLDMNPDRAMTARVRATVERGGDRIDDFHLWRLGPGHLGGILSVGTAKGRSPSYYRSLLRTNPSLAHVTVEVTSLA